MNDFILNHLTRGSVPSRIDLMDRRWSARKRIRQRAVLEAPNIGLIVADMHDASLGGTFVDTNSVVLPHNAPVVVDFKIPRGGRNESFRLDAIVVRRSSTGAGLMFLHMAPAVIRALSDALSQYGTARHGSARPKSAT